MAGGIHDGGVHGRGACVAGETATAADGMHPTGMHSYFKYRHIKTNFFSGFVMHLHNLQNFRKFHAREIVGYCEPLNSKIV